MKSTVFHLSGPVMHLSERHHTQYTSDTSDRSLASLMNVINDSCAFPVLT